MLKRQMYGRAGVELLRAPIARGGLHRPKPAPNLSQNLIKYSATPVSAPEASRPSGQVDVTQGIIAGIISKVFCLSRRFGWCSNSLGKGIP